VGPAPSVARAIALVQSERLDAAIVDLRLANGELAIDVCEALQAKAVPYLLLTGWHLGPDPGVPVILKPFERRELFEALRSLLAPAHHED
jgi:DNA-binding response OmpR family regulator